MIIFPLVPGLSNAAGISQGKIQQTVLYAETGRGRAGPGETAAKKQEAKTGNNRRVTAMIKRKMTAPGTGAEENRGALQEAMS